MTTKTGGVMTSPPKLSVPDGFNFVNPDVLLDGMPLREFAELRRTAPVWWNHMPAGTCGFNDGGFWVISKHEHIKEISRNHDTWSSNLNGVALTFPAGAGPDQLEASKALLLNQDPPSHTRLRKLVSKLFTPRAVAAMHEALDTQARAIVSAVAEKDGGDFVSDIAVKLPVQAIFEMIGIPPEDHRQVFDWANEIIAMDDPDTGSDTMAAHAALLGYAYNLAEARRTEPRDDIVTTLVHADPDGEWMTEAEFGFFVLLLAVAGNETTRNAISHGLNAFMDNPDQWELYKRERPRTTADEIVRWSTPVYAFQRTARHDVELGDVTIRQGQRVGLFYGSANYDEDVFVDPHRFDITRNPNPHLGFGGSGAHYCIGANLARMEIDLMFNAIADILPDIQKVAEPRRLRSGLVNGVTELRVTYR